LIDSVSADTTCDNAQSVEFQVKWGRIYRIGEQTRQAASGKTFMNTLTSSAHVPPDVMQVLVETKHRLLQLYATRMKKLILFGSYARGDYTQGSDLDLLLLLTDLPDLTTERNRYLPVACDLSLKHDTLISIVPMDYATYKKSKTPLILNVRREGLTL
jgi:hypothetical protein